jgi:hypothetical protein
VKRPTRAAPFDAATRVKTSQVSREWRTWSKRLALSIAGASFAGTLGAFVDALWARASVDGAHAPGYWALARIDAGLVAPLSLCIGTFVGVFALALEPDRARSPRELWQRLDRGNREHRLRVAGVLGSLCVGLAFGATAIAHFARAAMAVPGSNLGSGLALGALTLGILALVLVMALAMGELLTASTRGRPLEVRPSHALLVGMAVALVVIALGVMPGNTSGEGMAKIGACSSDRSSDLRPPSLVVLVALGANLPPHLMERTLAPHWPRHRTLVFTFSGRGLGDPSEIAADRTRCATRQDLLTSCGTRIDRDHDGHSGPLRAEIATITTSRINPAALTSWATASTKIAPAAMPSLAAPANAVGRPGEDERFIAKGLNVILITVDTLRADSATPDTGRCSEHRCPRRGLSCSTALIRWRPTPERASGLLLIGKYPSRRTAGGATSTSSTEDVFVSERFSEGGRPHNRRASPLVHEGCVRDGARLRPGGQEQAQPPEPIRTTTPR